MSQSVPLRASALAAAALVAATLTACGGSTTAAGIDVPGLAQELATVMRLERIGAGSELDMKASCTDSGDGLHFSCRVDAASHGTLVTSWTVLVECRAPGESAGHRCLTDTGYALQ